MSTGLDDLLLPRVPVDQHPRWQSWLGERFSLDRRRINEWVLRGWVPAKYIPGLIDILNGDDALRTELERRAGVPRFRVDVSAAGDAPSIGVGEAVAGA